MTVHLEDIGRRRRRRRFVPLALLLGLSSFVIGVALGDSSRSEEANAEAGSTTTTTSTTVQQTTSTTTAPTTSSSTTTTSTTEPPPPIDESAPRIAIVATRTELRAIDTRTGEPLGEPLDTIERLSSANGATRFGRVTLGTDGYVYYAALRELHVGSTYRVLADGTGEPEFVAQGVSPARQAIGDLLATVGPPTDPKLIITDVTGALDTQIIPGQNSDRHNHPTWAPEGRFLIFELLDVDDTSRLVYLRSGDEEYPTIASARPITRSEGIGWTNPHWRARGEIVVIDQCCSMRGTGGARAEDGGAAVRRSVNPFQGNDTSELATVPFVVHNEYDAEGRLSLFVDYEGTLHWANDSTPPTPAADDETDEPGDEPLPPAVMTTGTIPSEEFIVAADW